MKSFNYCAICLMVFLIGHVFVSEVSFGEWSLYRESRKAQTAEPDRLSELKFDIEQLKQQIEQLRVELESLMSQTVQARQQVAEQSEQSKIVSRELSRLKKSADANSAIIRALQDELKQRDIGALTVKTKALLDAGRYQEVIGYLRPTLPKIAVNEHNHDDLLMYYARSLFEIKSYAEAALKADDIEKFHPKSPHVPSAILLQGRAFLRLGKRQEAKIFFQEVIKRYQNSQEAKRAQKLLSQLTSPKKQAKKVKKK